MLLFYRETKYIIISLITIIIDGIIIYFIPSYFNQINYFYPMLTISLLPFFDTYNSKRRKVLIIFIGIIYDILYSNIILYNTIIFIILSIIDNEFIKYFKTGIVLFAFLTILNIIVYDVINYLLIIITNYQLISIQDLIYKIKHSIILNIMSVFVFWFLFKKNVH